MSYHNGGHYNSGGGGGRRNNRGRYHDKHDHGPEPPERKLRNAIIKLADSRDAEPDEEIPRLAKYIQENLPISTATVAEGLRVGVTEQPYKIPHYAALVAYLFAEAASSEDSNITVVQGVLEDFVKGFQVYLDELKWLHLRLCMHFFSHLVVLNVISSSSLLFLLQSVIAVLDEPGVSYYRSRCAALCAGETLLRCGKNLMETDSAAVNGIINALQSFADSSKSAKPLVSPIIKLHEKPEDAADSNECRETIAFLVKALNYLQASSFGGPAACLPQPQASIPLLAESASDPPAWTPYTLPAVLVPPDAMDMDEDVGLAPGPTVEDGKPKPAFKSEVPSVYVKLFENDITPGEATPSDYIVRACVQDMLDIFEVNRKEAARLLLELPKWFSAKTFKGRNEDDDALVSEDDEVMDWGLECTIVETTLSTAFLLPVSPHLAVYYYALITDLCKLSPGTVGPAVGKSIRKLYRLLEDSAGKDAGALDVETAKRFGEWFAVHMGNFGFSWVWKEWIPDLSLSQYHPRRRFIRRVIDLEIRASYYDRIKETLPTDYHEPTSWALPDAAPGPSFEYGEPSHRLYGQAQTIISLIRERTGGEQLQEECQRMAEELAMDIPEKEATSDIRTAVVQAILHVGSRSFSHFLNAIERYLLALRFFSKDTNAKAEVLDSVSRFWRKNTQMIVIVFDKLMQYQVVDPSDVVSWSFRSARFTDERETDGSVGTLGWQTMKAALDKAAGRVMTAKHKITRVKKLQEDIISQAKAKEGAVIDVGMEVDMGPKDDASESPAIINAQKALTTLTKDQKTAIVQALDGFIKYLGSTPAAARVLSNESWHDRESWGGPEWDSWETWCWFRHFCRLNSPTLRTYMNTLEAVSLSRLDSVAGVDTNAAAQIRRIWDLALGGE